jgi:hypothetical protein
MELNIGGWPASVDGIVAHGGNLLTTFSRMSGVVVEMIATLTVDWFWDWRSRWRVIVSRVDRSGSVQGPRRNCVDHWKEHTEVGSSDMLLPQSVR